MPRGSNSVVWKLFTASPLRKPEAPNLHTPGPDPGTSAGKAIPDPRYFWRAIRYNEHHITRLEENIETVIRNIKLYILFVDFSG
jgi:hypothetical protein